MRYHSHGRLRHQIDVFRQQSLQQGSLPSAEVLSAEGLEEAVREITVPWKDRIFTPLVTPWVSLGQALAADQSCRAAVARLVAHRAAAGAPAVQLRDGGVLPGAEAPAGAVRLRRGPPRGADPGRAGRPSLAPEGPPRRPVRRIDGRHARHAGQPGAYPLAYDQRPGTNFALARVGAVIALSCGAILDLGVCRYAGKGQGEVSPLRRLWGVLRPGDVPLGDRLMSDWVGIHLLKRRGVETVSRLNKAARRADFRQGARLGKDDHLVLWKKPTSIRPVDRETYRSPPDSITVREARFRVQQPGFRTRSVVVVTTLLRPEQAAREDLAALDRARWDNELGLRSIKVTLQMGVLRCKAPELARKEVWAHVLAYNLIRAVMAQAAARAGCPPRSISFTATLQVLEAFRPLIAHQAHRGACHRAALDPHVLRAIAVHRVADRPDRSEPRVAQRRPKRYDRLTRPRQEIKRRMLNRFGKI